MGEGADLGFAYGVSGPPEDMAAKEDRPEPAGYDKQRVKEANKRYIVWNLRRTEGFATDNRADAKTAQTGTHPNGIASTLAIEFFEAYGDYGTLLQVIVMEKGD